MLRGSETIHGTHNHIEVKHDKQMPVLFISHGAPNIILQNDPVLVEWKNLAHQIPQPQCILLISAHWETSNFVVSGNQNQKIIYDFYGFPKELYDYQYPAPSVVKWADKLATRLGIKTDHNRGLDHAAWVPLSVMYPLAEIPIIQMSVSPLLDFQTHFKMGKNLASLREQGILIVASGSLVHNLGLLNWQSKLDKSENWSLAFMESFESALFNHDDTALCHPHDFLNGELAVPTAEHYLPFLMAYAAGKGSEISSYCQTWRYGCLGMHSYCFS